MDALMTDFYEFTMGEGFFHTEKFEQIACFDLVFRRCPDKESFVIANGVQDCVNHFLNLKYTDKDIEISNLLGTSMQCRTERLFFQMSQQ